MSSILSDRPIISTITSITNRRISNVQTLSKTLIDNVQTNMSTRINAIGSLAHRTPTSGQGLGILQGLTSGQGLGILQGLKAQIGGFLMQLQYPQYVQGQVQVPGQPVIRQVPVTQIGQGKGTAVTVVQPAPTIVTLPVQSI